MATRIAFRVGVDADELQIFDSNAGFFEDFTTAGCFGRLSDFYKTTRQGMTALERRIFTANE